MRLTNEQKSEIKSLFIDSDILMLEYIDSLKIKNKRVKKILNKTIELNETEEFDDTYFKSRDKLLKILGFKFDDEGGLL